MKRYRFPGIIVLVIAALHFSTYALNLNGFATVCERNVYFCASAGKILVGSIDLGALAALAQTSPTINFSTSPIFEIDGMGNTHMTLLRPSFGTMNSPVWPGIALPILLLLFLPVVYTVSLAARSAEQAGDGKPDTVAS